MTDATDTVSAGVFRRLAALFYDGLLLMAVSMAYGALALAIKVHLLGQEVTVGERAEIGWPGFVGWVVVLVGFYCYFWLRSGQTLGMRAWRLQLVSRRPAPLSLAQCLLRCPLALLSLAPLGAGYFWRWFDPQQLTLHDRLSHTEVRLLPKRT